MKERPIIFNGDMVRAILDNRKTQTRQPIKLHIPHHAIYEGVVDGLHQWYDSRGGRIIGDSCPYGVVGDRLWVRETWRISDHVTVENKPFPMYLATYDSPFPLTWRPSILMPRWASRITLVITGVRVERVQAISGNDAISEGVSSTEFWKPKDVENTPFDEKWWDDFNFWNNYPQIAYRNLWDSFNAKRGYTWDSNPWVWVIEFKKVEEK